MDILAGAEIVPDGIDPDVLKGEIMLQFGLLQPLYSEPEIMKNAIIQWFQARQWTFQHLLNIITAEYSPIENVDRHDQWTRTVERALDRTDNATDGINETYTRSNTETSSATDERETENSLTRNTESDVDTTGETIGQVSAFNSSSWQNSDKNNSTGNTTGSEDVTESGTGSVSDTHSGTKTLSGTDGKTGTNTHRNIADEDEDTTETYTQHLHGNIGVTTNQAMIEQELALLAHFNIYSWIAMNLRDSLFLEVY